MSVQHVNQSIEDKLGRVRLTVADIQEVEQIMATGGEVRIKAPGMVFGSASDIASLSQATLSELTMRVGELSLYIWPIRAYISCDTPEPQDLQIAGQLRAWAKTRRARSWPAFDTAARTWLTFLAAALTVLVGMLLLSTGGYDWWSIGLATLLAGLMATTGSMALATMPFRHPIVIDPKRVPERTLVGWWLPVLSFLLAVAVAVVAWTPL